MGGLNYAQPVRARGALAGSVGAMGVHEKNDSATKKVVTTQKTTHGLAPLAAALAFGRGSQATSSCVR